MFLSRPYKIARVLFCSLSIITLADLLFVSPRAFAASPEISVSCGDTNTSTTVRTRRQLQNVRSIRIVVDPANKCHVDISIELKDESRKYHSDVVPPRKSTADQSAGDKLNSQCFNFAGRRYCE
jgi:hypothetical protein